MKHLSPQKLIKKNPFILAPMDDVTDIGFRELCEKHGASYSTTELTSIDALIRNKVFKSRYEKGNLKINSVQLFGSNPKIFIDAAKIVSDEADLIDINFGCPSPNVTRQDAGSSLLKDPKNVGKIISNLVKEIDKPITAKIRLGYDKTNALSIAKEIEDAGASLITIHGRTAKQKYSGKANWDEIEKIYSNLKIPVVGNGDISTEEDIDDKLDSKCDALMVGRAAIGNPMLFERFNYYKKTGKKLEFNIKEKQKQLFIEYIKNLEGKEFYNLPLKISRQAMWFFKGIEGAKELRKSIVHERDIKKILEIIEKF